MKHEFCPRAECAVRKVAACLLLLLGIPNLTLAEIGRPREVTQNGARVVAISKMARQRSSSKQAWSVACPFKALQTKETI
jgi:hypothetical protein